MQLTELSLGAENKRPGPVQYSSDTRSAWVKLAIHPGDTYQTVLDAARDALSQALAPTKPPPPQTWTLQVRGAPTPHALLSDLGLNWRHDHYQGTFNSLAHATTIERVVHHLFPTSRIEWVSPPGPK